MYAWSSGRDGIGAEALTELAELVWAADGRTLGLFASQRSAELAVEHLRTTLPDLTFLCQGEAQLSELTRTSSKIGRASCRERV